MPQVYIKGQGCNVGCSVINLHASSLDVIKPKDMIELDERDWGGGLNSFEVISIDKDKKEILVRIPTQSKFRAYPTSNSEIYS